MSKSGWVLARHLAKIVTGPDDQDVAILLVGRKGSGKSGSSLSLSTAIAHEIAKIIGGNWTDYFKYENVAIIDPKVSADMITRMLFNNVYIFDDIGLGWGARKWTSAENQDKNDLFQINRTDRTVQIFTVPDQFLLDKVPRNLVTHLAIMDNSNPKQFFRHNKAIMRVYEPETLFHIGKQLYPFIHENLDKFVAYEMPKPPAWMMAKYRKDRKAIKDKVAKDKRERVFDGGKTDKQLKREQVAAERAFQIEEVNRRKAQEGVTLSEACRDVGITRSQYYNGI